MSCYGCYGSLWTTASGCYGQLWVYGMLWAAMDTIVSYGLVDLWRPWSTMDYCYGSNMGYCYEFYTPPWATTIGAVVYHYGHGGLLWATAISCCGLLWALLALWSTIDHNYRLLLSTIVWYGAMVYYWLLWSTIVYYGPLLWATIGFQCHCGQLWTTALECCESYGLLWAL